MATRDELNNINQRIDKAQIVMGEKAMALLFKNPDPKLMDEVMMVLVNVSLTMLHTVEDSIVKLDELEKKR